MTSDSTTHLTAEHVTAFLDRRMTAAERAAAENHLADCRVCRAEIIEVRRLLARQPMARPRVLVPLGIAAAAAIVFIALNLGQVRNDPESERVRTPAVTQTGDASRRISVLSPVDGDTLAPGRPVLSWSAVVGEPTYRLTMTDASGQPVWTSNTTDTTVTLPANGMLQPRHSYYWYVDALRADGRAASTGVHSFTTP